MNELDSYAPVEVINAISGSPHKIEAMTACAPDGISVVGLSPDWYQPPESRYYHPTDVAFDKLQQAVSSGRLVYQVGSPDAVVVGDVITKKRIPGSRFVVCCSQPGSEYRGREEEYLCNVAFADVLDAMGPDDFLDYEVVASLVGARGLKAVALGGHGSLILPRATVEYLASSRGAVSVVEEYKEAQRKSPSWPDLWRVNNGFSTQHFIGQYAKRHDLSYGLRTFETNVDPHFAMTFMVQNASEQMVSMCIGEVNGFMPGKQHPHGHLRLVKRMELYPDRRDIKWY